MATDPNRLAGTAYIAVDGQSYAIVGEGTYRPDQETRESLPGQDGIHGYKAMPAPGRISWRGRDQGGVSLKSLGDAGNVTITLELANGKTVVGRNMWRVGDPLEVNTEEATYEAAFEGPEVREH
ncbi:phage tail tube protein [Flavisphingomonas formosensis]|uniref:phage tail tube protein n=1 Tax=Flavisphingomonas formosensis TaxID=861534 RepID=UPI0012F9BDB3|nr:phage tail tube protein [Sphingomonas formosensis]